MNEVKYMGQVISDKGIKADPSHIKGKVDMHVPNSKGEVKRLLGMVNFLSKFIPYLSQINAPLRDLIKQNNEFKWEFEQTAAFNHLKQEIDVRSSKNIPKSLVESNLCFNLISISENEFYVQCKDILFNGIKYCAGQILCFNYQSSVTFAEIKSIWFVSKSIYFWSEINLSQFNEHFHFYEVTSTKKFVMFSTKDLKDYYPLNAYKVKNYKEKAISLHHALDMHLYRC